MPPEASNGHDNENTFAELDKLLLGIAGATDSHSDWVGQWASRYVEFSADLGAAMAKQTIVAVLNGFGQKFMPDSSTIFAFKGHGNSYFKNAHTHKGNNAAISDLKLWRSQTIDERFESVRVGADIESHIYTARFGHGPSHVGIAVSLDSTVGTEIVFIPIPMVTTKGLSVMDAAAFVAHQMDGKGNVTDFVRNRHGDSQPAAELDWNNPVSRAAAFGCNYRALAACSSRILATIESELESAKEIYDQAINEIVDGFVQDSVKSIVVGVVAGAGIGALGGALAGGGPIGALIGGAVGAIGGAFAGLLGASFDARDARTEIKEANADYADAICQAKGRAMSALVECIKEHCPDAADAAEQWAERQIGIEDCVWN